MSQSLEVVDAPTKDDAAKADSVTVQVSKDELTKLITDGIDASAERAAGKVGTDLAGTLGAIDMGGTVALVDEQYDTIVKLDSTQLHVSVAALGVLSLVLGAVVAISMTMHWRGTRG